MKKNAKITLLWGVGFLALFALWTALIRLVDVQPLGQNGTDIGFAAFNCYFHKLTGANMTLYYITDWAGLVPVFICMGFGILGLSQLIKRKSLFKVDRDICTRELFPLPVPPMIPTVSPRKTEKLMFERDSSPAP